MTTPTRVFFASFALEEASRKDMTEAELGKFLA
jgi:hypothetical protein